LRFLFHLCIISRGDRRAPRERSETPAGRFTEPEAQTSDSAGWAKYGARLLFIKGLRSAEENKRGLAPVKKEAQVSGAAGKPAGLGGAMK